MNAMNHPNHWNWDCDRVISPLTSALSPPNTTSC